MFTCFTTRPVHNVLFTDSIFRPPQGTSSTRLGDADIHLSTIAKEHDPLISTRAGLSSAAPGVRTITLFLLRCIRGGSNEEFASHTICCRPPFTWRSFASVHSERERMCVCECVCVREVWRMALFFVRRRSPVPSHASCCDWCASERGEHCLFFVVAGVLHVK